MAAALQGAGQQKSLVLFLHGFNSGPECWDTMLRLMNEDAAITAAFDLRRFQYQSKVTYGLFNVLSRLPDYDDITAKFDQFVREQFTSRYDQLYLVGHSQGGLIIQSWMGKLLSDGEAERLECVREAIFICTPTLGSPIASGARKLVFSVIRDPQETRLRVLDEDVAKTRRMIEERIVQTSVHNSTQWPVPILAIWGQEDGVVSASSAQASFVNLLTVDGDHSSVLSPGNRFDDTRYTVLAGALLAPVGHLHIFEVERYETLIAVQPMDDPNYVARRGATETNKVADNVANITRTVKFSPRNVSVDLFRFNYLTGRNGFLEASFDELGRKLGTPMPVNEAPGDMKGRWNKGENDVIYDFRPVAGRTYRYDVKVWGGFSAGNRDVHFHFEGNARCAQYVFTVDISAYVAKGWAVNRVPEVYIDAANTAEHQIGEQRLPSNRVACTQADPAAGRWTWIISDFRGGIVDAVWDLTPPAGKSLP